MLANFLLSVNSTFYKIIPEFHGSDCCFRKKYTSFQMLLQIIFAFEKKAKKVTYCSACSSAMAANSALVYYMQVFAISFGELRLYRVEGHLFPGPRMLRKVRRFS